MSHLCCTLTTTFFNRRVDNRDSRWGLLKSTALGLKMHRLTVGFCHVDRFVFEARSLDETGCRLARVALTQS